MRSLQIVPSDTKIPFISFRKFAYPLSVAMCVISIVFFFVFGLNFGIDFRGGTLIEVQSKAEIADISEIRSTLGDLSLGDVEIQQFGTPKDVLIRVEQQPGGETAQQAVIGIVKQALGEDAFEFRRVEVVGPKVSGELVITAIEAVIGAIIAVLIYIWFRFEWQFAVGAVMALVHDVIITIGMFSLLQLEFNLSIIAALLTIVGYSLNDTVVVYDRVRENLRKFKKMPLEELLDSAMNQTLSRTVLTSVTTLIALLSIYILGGEVIRGMIFAMIWGVLIGTYSSAFVAAPLLLHFNIRRDWSGNKLSDKEVAAKFQ